jgi:hypothetical protein
MCTEFAFWVPSGHSDGAGRLTMPMSMSLEDVVTGIYHEMECESFAVKPALKYKMKKTSSTPITLASKKDWNGMTAHTKSLGKKDTVICTIVVDKQVSVATFSWTASVPANIITLQSIVPRSPSYAISPKEP